ncbi:hypothetical protein GCM10017688_05500 [Streptomyces ramulosus]
MSRVIFEELPPFSRSTASATIRHTGVAEALRANPTRWARIQEREKPGDAAGFAYQIRKGILAAFRPTGHFEAKSRTVGKVYHVYARYVGPAAESTEIDNAGTR